MQVFESFLGKNVRMAKAVLVRMLNMDEAVLFGRKGEQEREGVPSKSGVVGPPGRQPDFLHLNSLPCT